uniref:Dolichyl-diphosphooligosaccharide--protein glycosyltransferase subunit OST2 n=1 Tax=Palpitomonas bilix TaxID=652834 RepID=A0A7S3G266_9EUKA|mmetsp:Transcript_12749/g.33743  ORF Transcript_12749/g.33743 Transcript_12749/m.33743 type:complete len:122 (+) Transcript_12749:165-530(+)|eukprot:CAMPEP_0113884494 /NCGR_PEP_ID=MMETSP0780_2-20120614/10299_1 /TAXON_ID=652834 /ORGANISM="Palpitomonas bilix" /LENGTH=121 /DNA_ID=CAMNT_0000872141 /DNA_START=179 /DNA_END=544 /DNA_ORIENTATION=+ /assembly_acc=CAM_ASM_000599
MAKGDARVAKSDKREAGNMISSFFSSYSKSESQLKVIDTYLIFTLIVGLIQFGYMVLVGTFPFNSFLAGFLGAVGAFVLAVCLRLQVEKPSDFANISRERAFADFVFCNLILFFVCVNFLG